MRKSHMPASKTPVPRLALLAAVLAALILAGSCVTTEPGGKEAKPLTHHNWWNYYERGCAYLAEKDYKAAAEDFETALGIRGGARFGFPQEMWRARTYGLHFVEGYFPHRELGICLYEMKETGKAIEYLQKSLDQEPSGRAKHYLNLARARTLEETARAAPVKIELAGGIRRSNMVRDRSFTVSGTASSEGMIAQLSVNNKAEFIELAAPKFTFSKTIALKEGANEVVVVARNLSGRGQKTTFTVTADWRPPAIGIRKVQKAAGGGWSVEFQCSDDNALASVKANGEQKLPPAGQDRQSSFSFECAIAEGKSLAVTAEDHARNSMTARFTPGDLAGLADIGPAGDRPEAELASSGTPGMPVMRGASDGNTAQDKTNPSIFLFTEAKQGVILRDEFYFDCCVVDRGGVGAVQLNGLDLAEEKLKGSLQVRIARRLPLEMGTNRFSVTAGDLSGNRESRQVTIVRKAPECLDSQYRLAMDVPSPLRCDEARFKEALRRSLQAEITREPARFNLLERDEKALTAIIAELELSSSELADKQAALKIGRILPVEIALFTSLIRNGSGLTLYARVVETDTGRIIWTGDVYAESQKDLVEQRVPGLAMKVEQNFPLIEGHVVEAGGKITIDAGSSMGARPGMRFLVVKPAGDELRDQKGIVAKHMGKPLELQLDLAKNDESMGRIIPSEATGRVKDGDYVYTR